MNLNESVTTLQNLLPKLTASDAKFASSLIASFKKYNGLTPKQEPWIGRLIAKATPAPVFSAPLKLAVAPVVSANVGGFEGVIALFTAAKAHLKFPKITLVCKGTTVKLSLLGLKSKYAGSVNITDGGKYPYAKWFGRVTPEGVFTAAVADAEFTVALTALLQELSANPARVAKEHGKLSGLCCFCNKVLGAGEDKRSIAVGFGPVCANHYGLKAEWLAGAAKAEAGITEVPTLTADIAAVNEAMAGATAPVLIVTPAAAAVIETLAEELAASKANAPSPELAEALADLYEPKVTTNEVGGFIIEPAGVECFICGEYSTETKILHEHTVCMNCVKQLI